ncbi:hypothetical protein [Dyella telluris]|uniref:Uncharacterized protein n=1 Tax=Dyella telluris TaxID=2763498 RepID=A0A7G8Q245_9GAMM|nr:hypothetical protein [Dyella telluris]QNK00853.1 hypothetical protein H8F01_17505 [Dyella telluris]
MDEEISEIEKRNGASIRRHTQLYLAGNGYLTAFTARPDPDFSRHSGVGRNPAPLFMVVALKFIRRSRSVSLLDSGLRRNDQQKSHKHLAPAPE